MNINWLRKRLLRLPRWLQSNIRVCTTKKSTSLSVSDEENSSVQSQTTMNPGYNFEYLMRMDKTYLAYRAIRLQRKLDSYMKTNGSSNIDGREKVRIEHPNPEDIIDHYEYNMRRVAFKVVYIGWSYMAYAWAENPDRTCKGHTNVVERVFLEALCRQQLVRRIGPRIKLDRAGRTDQDVSGLSQVICVDIRTNLKEGYGVWSIRGRKTVEGEIEQEAAKFKDTAGESKIQDDEVLLKESSRNSNIPNNQFSITDTEQDDKELPYLDMLNEALPVDIRVVAWSPVSRYFSPRSSCKSRTYKYFFPRGTADVGLMHETAQKLVGEHDFRNFGKLSNQNMHLSYLKSIYEISVAPLPHAVDPRLPSCDICVLTVKGSSFMYRQVRFLTYVLCSVGKGFEHPSVVDRLLDVDEDKGRPSYSSAEAYPLLFYDTEFDENDIHWRWDQKSLANTAEVMADMWMKKALKSQVLKTCFSDVLGKIENRTTRRKVEGSMLNHLINGAAINHRNIPIFDNTNSSNVRERQEKELARDVRRLQIKGIYDHAAYIHKQIKSKN